MWQGVDKATTDKAPWLALVYTKMATRARVEAAAKEAAPAPEREPERG
jgi:hypothetical protein